MRKEIESAQKDIDKLKLKKEHYIGITAESFANKKFTYYKLTQSYYKDEKLLEKLVGPDSEIDDIYYYELIELYNQFQDKLSGDNLKMLSISPFFTNLFYLCDDNAFNFYGKPIIQLTNYQVDLISLGRYFKNILSNHPNIPIDVRSKPDELMDWIEIKQNAKDAKVIDENNELGGAGSIVGAQKKDLEMLGITPPKDSLGDKIKKAGGKLGMSEMLKDME
jgi:hypothetical protein